MTSQHSSSRGREPVYLMLPLGHRAAAARSVRLADLAEDSWVLPPSPENGVRWRFLRACEAAGFTPKVRHYTSESSTGRGLLAQGAIALAAAGARGNGVAIRPIAGDPIHMEIMLATRSDTLPAQRFDELYRCACSAYRPVVDRDASFASWWREHPLAHAELDATLANTALGPYW